MNARRHLIAGTLAVGVLSLGPTQSAPAKAGTLKRSVTLVLPSGKNVGERTSLAGGALVTGFPGTSYVFGKSVPGWGTSPVAEIAAGASAIDGNVAARASGDLASPGSPTYDVVTAAPADGWHGSVSPSAKLTASDGAFLQEPAISSGWIAAVGLRPPVAGPKGPVYVFARPAGGWTGTITQSAVLVPRSGTGFLQVAAAGRVAAASDGTKVEIFVEPAGGWSGTVRPSATLLDPTGAPLVGLAVARGIVLAGQDVFTAPAGGWAGRLRPTSHLIEQGALAGAQPTASTASPDAVALATEALGPEHACPCRAAVWVFTRPKRGWSGTLAASPSLRPRPRSSSVGVEVDGHQFFVATDGEVSGFTINGRLGHDAGLATTRATISGLGTGRPRINLRIGAETGGQIASLQIVPPHGLTFVRRGQAALRRARLTTSQRTARIARGTLRLSFRSPVPEVTLQIPSGLLTETRQLQASSAAGHGGDLTVRLRAMDPYGSTDTTYLKLAHRR